MPLRLHTESLFPRNRMHVAASYMSVLILTLATTLCCEAIRPYVSPANMVMVYLMAVVLASLWLGLKQAILTAFLGVLAFDFFFVPPRLTFNVADKEYLITFLGLFGVGVIISTLVAKVQDRAEKLKEREAETASLYRLSRDLAVAADMQSVVLSIVKNVEVSLDASAVLLLADGDKLGVADACNGWQMDSETEKIAQWAFKSMRPAGAGTSTFQFSEMLFVPLHVLQTPLGVLGISFNSEPDSRFEQMRHLLEAFGTQAALALERVRLSQQAEHAQILKARENLERALLNSVSHDLRTPLVTITGVLSAIRNEDNQLSEKNRHDLVDTAWEEAGRLNRFVGNLLDMTRLEAGELKLKLESCDVQDLVGCALASVEHRLGKRVLDVRLPPDLLLVRMDLVLMTQVLVNLIDNALKYSPPESHIEIAAHSDKMHLTIEVADRGPGIPLQDLAHIFDKFHRISVPEGVSGTGLGLSICKGIVEAHGGKIYAENRMGGGLRLVVELPDPGMQDAGGTEHDQPAGAAMISSTTKGEQDA
jgi:two-component system sensor histidine kinase KdpD